jgi:hypothetical protein
MPMKDIIHKSCLLLSLILFFSSGCYEREDPVVASGSTLEADNALREAEAKLETMGLSLSFEEPGDLILPEKLIPDPGVLADEIKQKDFEEIIGKLNVVLTELEQEGPNSPLGSVSDMALVHLYLGLVYVFDAMTRLQISDDPAETLVIENNTQDGFWYSFGVSPATKAELDAVQNPLDYPLVFTHKERQAIIDAADLIDDAIVKPRAPEIQPRLSSVDRPPYSKYAIWHFEKAATLFGQYKPDVKDALDDLNESLGDMRAEIQARSESWGFTYTLPPWR